MISMEDILEVIDSQKDDLDFIQKNGAWMLTIIGICSACMGGVLTYFLKSRCRKLKLGCLECDREVVTLNPNQTTVSTSTE